MRDRFVDGADDGVDQTAPISHYGRGSWLVLHVVGDVVAATVVWHWSWRGIALARGRCIGVFVAWPGGAATYWHRAGVPEVRAVSAGRTHARRDEPAQRFRSAAGARRGGARTPPSLPPRSSPARSPRPGSAQTSPMRWSGWPTAWTASPCAGRSWRSASSARSAATSPRRSHDRRDAARAGVAAAAGARPVGRGPALGLHPHRAAHRPVRLHDVVNYEYISLLWTTTSGLIMRASAASSCSSAASSGCAKSSRSRCDDDELLYIGVGLASALRCSPSSYLGGRLDRPYGRREVPHPHRTAVTQR